MAEAMHDAARLFCIAPDAEPEADLARFAIFELEWDLERGARIHARAHASRQPRTRHSRRVARSAIAPEKLRTIAAQNPGGVVGMEEGDPPREIGDVRIARENRAGMSVYFGDDVHRRLRPEITEHPLDVAGRRELTSAAGEIANLQH